MKALTVIFTFFSMAGMFITIGAAGSCDINTITSTQATGYATIGIACMAVGSIGLRIIKKHLYV